MCTCLQLLPHIPASSTVCVYVDAWLHVFVYMQSTRHPHRVRDTVVRISVHMLPKWMQTHMCQKKPLTRSCSPTSGQMHNLPVPWKECVFLDQKEHGEARGLTLYHDASFYPHWDNLKLMRRKETLYPSCHSDPFCKAPGTLITIFPSVSFFILRR